MELTFGNEAVFEHELTCVAASHAELVQLLVSREALEALLDDKRRNALGTLIGQRLCVDHQRRRGRAVRNPGDGG